MPADFNIGMDLEKPVLFIRDVHNTVHRIELDADFAMRLRETLGIEYRTREQEQKQ